MFRADHLLDHFRAHEADTLARIDADPLLVKRQAGDLVLANASKLLFSPREPHQMLAKGVVYRRDPHRLVALPLLKIFNLRERAGGPGAFEALADARLVFLRKFDGTMLHRFQDGGRVYLATRGMLEGGVGVQEDEAPAHLSHFDYLGAARAAMAERHPRLLEARPEWDGLSFVFEFLHPRTRVITDYGGRTDVVLLALFDRADWRYRTHAEVVELAAAHGLSAADALTPAGATLAERIDHLLPLFGADEEGAVLNLEVGGRVVDRVKVKTPDYLRLLRLMVDCTYRATADALDAYDALPTWEAFAEALKARGAEKVPEEVLDAYRDHYDAHVAHLAAAGRLLDEVRARGAHLSEGLPPEGDARGRRRAFAARVQAEPERGLLFLAYDGRLTLADARERLSRGQ